MTAVRLTTYADLVYHLTDFLEGDPSGVGDRDCRRAVQSALDTFANEHSWTLYYTQGRINTVAPYETGTVTYDHTGGTYERQVTLTDGTWPTWATFGHIVIDNTIYEIAERISNSVITLTSASNPGEDIADAATFSLRRDTYPMPHDFIASDELINVQQCMGMMYVHPRHWLAKQRLVISPAFPTQYTFTGDPNYLGTLAVRFYPPPDQAYGLDFLYRRRPRSLKVDEYSTGTVSISGSSNLVTGTGTSWTSKHIGTVLRFSDSRTDVPTGLSGAYPYLYERVVTDVTSTTGITLDSTVPETLSGVKYSLSDPLDIEDGAMRTAFLRCCEWQLSIARQMKRADDIELAYKRALTLAQEADSRSLARRAAGVTHYYHQRLSHMPGGEDIG